MRIDEWRVDGHGEANKWSYQFCERAKKPKTVWQTEKWNLTDVERVLYRI
jgi:hypothetical protein